MLPLHRVRLVLVHRESNIKVGHQLELLVSLIVSPLPPLRVRWRLSARADRFSGQFDPVGGKDDALGKAVARFIHRWLSSLFGEVPC